MQPALEYWRAVARSASSPSPAGRADGQAPSPEAVGALVVSFDREQTQALLQMAGRPYRTHTLELLLTAFGQSYSAHTGRPVLRVALTGPGRGAFPESGDWSRTIGQFDSPYPVALDLTAAASPREAILAVKEQIRRASKVGPSYGLLRYLRGEAEVAQIPQAEISFEYHDESRHMWPASFPFGLVSQPDDLAPAGWGPGPYGLAVEACVVDGRLQTTWTYRLGQFQSADVERLAHAWAQALQQLVAHCLSADAGGYTPADFPLAPLTQEQLDRLLPAHWQVEDIYPCSPLQAHMVAQYVAAPDPGLFIWQRVTTWDGLQELDIPVFERVLQRLVDRYPPLRTTFLWEGLDQPLQVVHARGSALLAYEDWRELSSDEREARQAAYLEMDRARGFNLKEPAVVRMLMVRLAENTYQSIFTGHYMRTDGWSSETLIDECYRFYSMFSRGQDLQLPLNRPYRDYIDWLQRQDQAAAESFWRQTLKGFSAATPLVRCAPGNAPGPATELARRHAYLSLSATTSLQVLARQQQLTLNTVVQGAWALLLSSYTGQPDVTFGVVVSGRPPGLPGSERIVGTFINALPLRVPVPADALLLPWLKEVMARQVELSQYEYTSQRKLRDWCGLAPGQPLFESFLVYQSLWAATARTRTAHRFYARWECPLRVDAFPQAEMALVMCYSQRYFDNPTAARMIGHLRTLLEAMAATPEQRLGDLQRVLAAE
jgi:non-ribosomal peptide synthase protein (TIGR01720 family)